MKPNRELGNAFMDIAFAGAVFATLTLVLDLVTGNEFEPGLLGLTVLTYGIYVIGAVRLGVSHYLPTQPHQTSAAIATKRRGPWSGRLSRPLRPPWLR
jgi:hypothetical protein